MPHRKGSAPHHGTNGRGWRRRLALLVVVLSESILVSRHLLRNATVPRRGGAEASAEEVPVHRESGCAASDVLRILHAGSRIEVHLAPNRRCSHPVFAGRISGAALAPIAFSVSGGGAADVAVGTYDPRQLPASAERYYVEIVELLCEDPLGWRGGDGDANGPDLTGVCLRDTARDHHRITAARASIGVHPGAAGRGPTSPGPPVPGRWLHEAWSERNGRRGTAAPPANATEPLYTRYQPRGCMASARNFKATKNTTACLRAADRSRFRPYAFRWREDGPLSNLNKPYLSLIPRDRAAVPGESHGRSEDSTERNHQQHVCFVGSSHSRTLWRKCESLVRRTKERQHRQEQQQQQQGPRSPPPLDLKCSFVDVKFPFQILRGCPLRLSPEECRRKVPPPAATNPNQGPSEQASAWATEHVGNRKCTHVVLGFFQWPFSLYQTEPKLTFRRWKQDMVDLVDAFRRASVASRHPGESGLFPGAIVLRSVHANGWKEHVSDCPPTDFRTPYNARVCNRMLGEIAESFGAGGGPNGNDTAAEVFFVDTGFVTDPVWDSAEDWSHHGGEVGTQEIKYLLYEMFKKDYGFAA
ncbi:unnamed protein product [Pseudo-nitzschia multistriata]|uniref:Uncharacterized protein n=1 Tax=Pseudo-nitzschia multistriata TaxID=183589 RepID=A0A448ZE85_9STRA|nr:unnamed protein product [Pseudo-nitzschia multistriata]